MAVLIGEINQLHAHICQALADPTRILILYALFDQDLTVTDLSEGYDIPQSTVSRHLKALRERGLVHSQRQGTASIYSLSDKRVIEALDIMRSLLSDLLKQNAELIAPETEN